MGNDEHTYEYITFLESQFLDDIYDINQLYKLASLIEEHIISDIEDNVIIDNLCQVAHNVHIGYGTAVAGGTTFAGSVKIGKFCIIGGTSVFNGHIEICDQAVISGMCMVMRSIDKPGVYSSGIPAQSNKEWRITAARVLHINDMYHKVNDMEKQIETLKSALAELKK